MSEIDYYEEVRQKLKIGEGLGTPKHERVMDFLRMIWNEEEVKLLNNFDGVGNALSAAKMAKKAGMDKKIVKKMLNDMADRGTIVRVANQFSIIPLAPGLLELYYLKQGDSKENLIKGAKILREVMNTVLPPMFFLTDTPILKPKMPIDAEARKIIIINENIKNESSILPTDLARELIEKNDVFVKLPCQCRLIGELAGEPCELTHSSENGCLACGVVADTLMNMGIGEVISKEEALEHLRVAEIKGLVHNGANSRGFESYALMCNCCSCHCAMLAPMKKHQVPGIQKSNYQPKINLEACVLCETCAKKCPMDAIYHKYPMKTDNSDEKMIIVLDKCIGCGVCAANCKKDAIIMEKVITKESPEQFPFDVNIFG